MIANVPHHVGRGTRCPIWTIARTTLWPPCCWLSSDKVLMEDARTAVVQWLQKQQHSCISAFRVHFNCIYPFAQEGSQNGFVWRPSQYIKLCWGCNQVIPPRIFFLHFPGRIPFLSAVYWNYVIFRRNIDSCSNVSSWILLHLPYAFCDRTEYSESLRMCGKPTHVESCVRAWSVSIFCLFWQRF